VGYFCQYLLFFVFGDNFQVLCTGEFLD